jgi:hypothetical protein
MTMSETTEEEERGKTKAVAVCDACGEVTPVRVWSDETIHPIGESDSRCCERAEYRVLERGEQTDAFVSNGDG